MMEMIFETGVSWVTA